MNTSISREKRTVEAMIRIYCQSMHGGKELCMECGELKDYALKRIEKCMYGVYKPACNRCKVHCYSPKYKEEIRKVMRFSGPRMIYQHPVMAIMHALK